MNKIPEDEMKRRKSPLKAVFLVLLLLVACAAGVYGSKRYMPTNERADLSRNSESSFLTQ